MKKIALITAGPTREYVDSIRYLSNASSGKMGTALAEELKAQGFRVDLILGPGAAPLKRFPGVSVVSALEMRREVLKRFARCGVFISCAAVSDFRPKRRLPKKLHRSGKFYRLDLVPNPDILYQAGRKKKHQILVGFALDDSLSLEHAKSKMEKKNCDLMVLNGPESMESDFASAAILHRKGKIEKLGKIRKSALAKKICRAILQLYRKRS